MACKRTAFRPRNCHKKSTKYFVQRSQQRHFRRHKIVNHNNNKHNACMALYSMEKHYKIKWNLRGANFCKTVFALLFLTFVEESFHLNDFMLWRCNNTNARRNRRRLRIPVLVIIWVPPNPKLVDTSYCKSITRRPLLSKHLYLAECKH